MRLAWPACMASVLLLIGRFLSVVSVDDSSKLLAWVLIELIGYFPFLVTMSFVFTHCCDEQ